MKKFIVFIIYFALTSFVITFAKPKAPVKKPVAKKGKITKVVATKKTTKGKVIAKPTKAVRQPVAKAVAPPPILDSIKTVEEFQRQLDVLIAASGLEKFKWGIQIYSLDKNKVIYAKHDKELFVPASVTKLFTSFTALSETAPNNLIKTSVYTDAPKIESNLNGNLYILGRGDAFLTISDLEILAEQIKKAGVNSISGSIYADPSFFDGISDRWKYSGDKDQVEPVPPVMPFSLEKDNLTVVVSSGATPGKPLNTHIFPASAAISKTVTGTTRNPAPAKKQAAPVKKSKLKRFIDDDDNVEEIDNNNEREYQYAYNQQLGDAGDFAMANRPARVSSCPVAVSPSWNEDGSVHLNISGSAPLNSTYSFNFHVKKLDIIVAGAFKQRLEAAGIKIHGSFGVKAQSEKGKIQIAEVGRPISHILNVVNKHSDNYLAEHIYKFLGATANRANNSEGARKYQRRLFDSLGICKDCVFNDGSGLSRRNRTSPASIVEVLSTAVKSTFSRIIDTTLSIAGKDGTLRNRMKNSRAEGNLHAKTGTHSNVSALAGYVKTMTGERLAFAIVFNGPGVGGFKQLENRIGIMMANLNAK